MDRIEYECETCYLIETFNAAKARTKYAKQPPNCPICHRGMKLLVNADDKPAEKA